MSVTGLYAITRTPAGGSADLLLEVEAALRGGAGVVQYRDKTGEAARRAHEAREIRERCRAYGAVFIVNDDVALARASDADGVHLGRDDGDWRAARELLGAGRMIGVSCYNDLERADRAQAAGMDYLAFGSVFASPTKPGAPRVSLDALRQARERYRCPLVAIGGIDLHNLSQLAGTGVDAVAVISALFDAEDVERTAADFVSTLNASTARTGTLPPPNRRPTIGED